jgi:hypothetical protein
MYFRGVPFKRTEIIPIEPDTVSTDEGKSDRPYFEGAIPKE